jgi:hypothetical protein
MTGSVSKIRPHGCHADSSCARPPRFQARLEARPEGTSGARPVRKNAEACADHLGEMVQALTRWARNRHLTDGHLTVLAIDPPSGRAAPPAGAGDEEPEPLSLAFSTIQLNE